MLSDFAQQRPLLVLLRHGESTANAEGLFTGLLDVPLSPRGETEAAFAAAWLGEAQIIPDTTFSSEQRRSIETVTVLQAAQVVSIDSCHRDWRLDERNYGALTRRSKQDVADEYGYEQFLEWRRSVDVPPPPMGDALFQELASSEPYRSLPPAALTRTESLRDVEKRVRAFHRERVLPLLRANQIVLVVAHGNSLRAYCAVLERLSDAQIRHLNIPTAHPLVYRFDIARDDVAIPGTYLDESGAAQAAEELRRVGGT